MSLFQFLFVSNAILFGVETKRKDEKCDEILNPLVYLLYSGKN